MLKSCASSGPVHRQAIARSGARTRNLGCQRRPSERVPAAAADLVPVTGADIVLLVLMSQKAQGIQVEVSSQYLEDKSVPSEDYYFFSYHVRICNQGEESAQLMSRRWFITDAEGRQEKVEGPGVVGEMPILRPGGEFEYTSYCPLPTAVGSMHGSYQMVTLSGRAFEAEIAPFTLAVPHAVN